MRKLTVLMILSLILAASGSGQVPNLPNIPNKQAPEQLVTDKIPSGVHDLTATDVEVFLDGIIPLQLAQQDIAGATVSIVKDGKILFAKGYGYADTAQKKPVSAEETLYRFGGGRRND
jgi:CubicO group peptidase (beta-lactamase class C family)